MSLTAALYSYITSQLSGTIGTRLYPVMLPEGATLPAVTYRVISGQSDEYTEGTTGTATTRVQFNIYSDTYAEAASVAEALRLAFHQYRGTTGGVFFNSVNLEFKLDLYDNPKSGTDQTRYVFVMDFSITHSETAI